jgi:hypothetical protein
VNGVRNNPCFRRLRQIFTSKKGASTVEYVAVLVVGVLFASLLYAVFSDGAIQEGIKEKIKQAIKGGMISPDYDQITQDDENGRVEQTSTDANPAPSSTREKEESGFLQGLRNASGEWLDDAGQWFDDIYEKDILGVWNDPGGYFLETIGWEEIKDSWNKAWDKPGEYFKDSWDNIVEGWNHFWESPGENTLKLIFDWEQFAESWSGKDDNGEQIPLLNRIWGMAESLPTPAKAIKVISIADGILIHDGCAKKKSNHHSDACNKGNNADSDENNRNEQARDIIANAKDEDRLINDLIDQNLDESSLYQSLREKYPEDKARAITQNILKGSAFNRQMGGKYPYNEIYIEKPTAKSGKVRLDSYNPATGEIVSRKYTQLAEIKPETAKSYINELKNKYPPGARVAEVPSQRKGSGHQNSGLAGQNLDGEMILEVPVQKGEIPQSILEYADKRDVTIRDQNGKILN